MAATRKQRKQTPRCGFCGCTAKKVKILIQGDNGHICGGCVLECRAVLDREQVGKVAIASEESA